MNGDKAVVDGSDQAPKLLIMFHASGQIAPFLLKHFTLSSSFERPPAPCTTAEWFRRLLLTGRKAIDETPQPSKLSRTPENITGCRSGTMNNEQGRCLSIQGLALSLVELNTCVDFQEFHLRQGTMCALFRLECAAGRWSAGCSFTDL